jgi:hypothetical protein
VTVEVEAVVVERVSLAVVLRRAAPLPQPASAPAPTAPRNARRLNLEPSTVTTN